MARSVSSAWLPFARSMSRGRPPASENNSASAQEFRGAAASPSVLQGHDSPGVAAPPSALQGHDYSRAVASPSVLKGHDSPGAAASPSVLQGHDYSRVAASPSVLKGHDFSRAEDDQKNGRALAPEGSFAPAPSPVLLHAALHSLGWLLAANLIGVWLAVLLLFPNAGRWLGAWSYGRWTPVHLNFELYGWMALPLVAWAMRIYRADHPAVATWSRAALTLWSLALTIGAVSWLSGTTSGKLFLDWAGFARIFFCLAILFLWGNLAVAYTRSWREHSNRPLLIRAVKLFGLALLVLVPFVLYVASSPSNYPAINPDTGGPTGASQLESTLIIVLILLLLPYGLTRRKPHDRQSRAGRHWITASWLLLVAEALLCLALGRADVSHHRPAQYLSLASLLAWVPLVPAYYNAFEWPRTTRPWRIATFAWWALLIPTGWAIFLPGVLDRLKFTDGLVGHSILAMAGFVTSLLIFILGVLLGETAEIFNSRRAFITWNASALAYVVLFLLAGWRESADPAFTIVPGPARNILYLVRLILGIAMTAASAEWLRQLITHLHRRGSPVPHPRNASQSRARETANPSVPHPRAFFRARGWESSISGVLNEGPQA